jgi:hypothetical protein
LHCNIWANSHIFQKCTKGLIILKQKKNKRKGRREIRKRKTLLLAGPKCTACRPSPTEAHTVSLLPVSSSPWLRAHAPAKRRHGGSHRRNREAEGIRTRPCIPPGLHCHLPLSPRSLSLDSLGHRAHRPPCLRRPRSHRHRLASPPCRSRPSSTAASPSPTNRSRGVPRRAPRARLPLRLRRDPLRLRRPLLLQNCRGLFLAAR